MALPKCMYFSQCGGCSSQHINYAVQFESKKLRLNHATGLKEIQAFSGEEYGYRSRMDFIFHSRGLGLRNKSGNVIDISKCPIANSKVNSLLTEVRKAFPRPDAFDMRKHTGTFRFAVIRGYDDTCVSFVLNPQSSRLTEAIDAVKKFAETTTADNVLITYVEPDLDESNSADYFAVKGRDELHESFLGKKFSYNAQGFFQNNHQMAEMMHEYVSKLVEKHKKPFSTLLDLYGGVGTFGIINSARFKQVFSVESFAGCTASAEKNILANDVKAKAINMVAAKLRKIALSKPLVVITDPPRSGMEQKAIDEVNTLQPDAIIYVSCNLEQLKKELPKFKGYYVKSAALFDLFPQTNHCEGVVELVRKE